MRRVTFTEVTRDAIVEALRNPREISADLVDAYRARLGLDYLVGFSVSPVLWQKVPGCAGKSAGRVQSVALRLVCEREAQIEAFVPTPFWRVAVDVRTPSGAVLTARVVAADGQVRCCCVLTVWPVLPCACPRASSAVGLGTYHSPSLAGTRRGWGISK